MASTLKITVIKAFALITITIAISIIALSSINVIQQNHHETLHQATRPVVVPSKRPVSRFLAEHNKDYLHHGRSLKPADHCHKDYEVCDIMYGKNYTCCGNKCFDLTIDKNNCGACHKKCKFTYDCCDGKCVDKAYDKRHCGRCNNKCLIGQYCVYGMCDYA